MFFLQKEVSRHLTLIIKTNCTLAGTALRHIAGREIVNVSDPKKEVCLTFLVADFHKNISSYIGWTKIVRLLLPVKKVNLKIEPNQQVKKNIDTICYDKTSYCLDSLT